MHCQTVDWRARTAKEVKLQAAVCGCQEAKVAARLKHQVSIVGARPAVLYLFSCKQVGSGLQLD